MIYAQSNNLYKNILDVEYVIDGVYIKLSIDKYWVKIVDIRVRMDLFNGNVDELQSMSIEFFDFATQLFDDVGSVSGFQQKWNAQSELDIINLRKSSGSVPRYDKYRQFFIVKMTDNIKWSERVHLDI